MRARTLGEVIAAVGAWDGMQLIYLALKQVGANGTAQIKGWTYQNIQQRVRWGRLFAQAFLNTSNAGNDAGRRPRACGRCGAAPRGRQERAVGRGLRGGLFGLLLPYT